MSKHYRVHHDYSRTEIKQRLETFDATRETSSGGDDNHIVTTLDGRTLRNVKVSDQYILFDFKDFVKSILDDLENVLRLEQYVLEIRKGTQEVSLLTAPIMVNGDEYRAAMYVLNSNDRTRALQFSAGLYRTKTESEIFMPVPDASTVRKVVHKGASFETKVDKMREFIQLIPGLINYQVRTLEELAKKEFSLREFLTEVVNENRDGIDYSKASLVRANAFTRQMFNNQYDKLLIDYNKLSPTDLMNLRSPLTFLRESTADITLNAYRALQWYIQIYLNRDVSVARRECNRFYKILENIGVVDVIETDKDKEKELENV
jgi:hypothetical protein